MLTLKELELTKSFAINDGNISAAVVEAEVYGDSLVETSVAKQYFLLATDTQVQCFVSDRADAHMADFSELFTKETN